MLGISDYFPPCIFRDGLLKNQELVQLKLADQRAIGSTSSCLLELRLLELRLQLVAMAYTLRRFWRSEFRPSCLCVRHCS